MYIDEYTYLYETGNSQREYYICCECGMEISYEELYMDDDRNNLCRECYENYLPDV